MRWPPEVSRGDVSVVLKEDGFAKRDAAGWDEKGGVFLLNPPEEVVLKSELPLEVAGVLQHSLEERVPSRGQLKSLK